MNLPSTLFPSIDLANIEDKYSDFSRKRLFSSWSSTKSSKPKNDIPDPPYTYNDTKVGGQLYLVKTLYVFIMRWWNFIEVLQIWVPSNPRGAERLPPDIVTPESDLYLRRLWGDPNEVGSTDLLYGFKIMLYILFGYGV